MNNFLTTLKKRNRTLYLFGWICLASAGVCLLISQLDQTMVLGISAWIKPAKFFMSSAIFCWSMGWLLYYLNEASKVRRFNIMVVVVLVFELGYIVFQAARGQKSHFNFSSTPTIVLYSLMGVAITLMVLWTGYFAFLFFRRKIISVSVSYLWGIRLGMTFFVIFALSAHLMASSTGHTVGAPDGSPGLPFVNWSTRFGDLRAAHFFGMHALQLLPLVGYYGKSLSVTITSAVVYFGFATALIIQALMGQPIFSV